MQNLFKIAILIVLIVSLVITGCSSSKKGQCGCPSKTGMVGYWEAVSIKKPNFTYEQHKPGFTGIVQPGVNDSQSNWAWGRNTTWNAVYGWMFRQHCYCPRSNWCKQAQGL